MSSEMDKVVEVLLEKPHIYQCLVESYIHNGVMSSYEKQCVPYTNWTSEQIRDILVAVWKKGDFILNCYDGCPGDDFDVFFIFHFLENQRGLELLKMFHKVFVIWSKEWSVADKLATS